MEDEKKQICHVGASGDFINSIEEIVISIDNNIALSFPEGNIGIC